MLRTSVSGFLLALCLLPTATAQDLETHRAALSAADPVVRARAVCHLKRLRSGAAPAVPELVALLGDDTALERDVCREITGKNGIWAMDWERTLTPGRLAADALGDIGPSALDALHRGLAGKNPTALRNTLIALGEIEDPSSVAPVASLLATAQDPDTREWSAWALGAIEDRAAVEPLTAALKDQTVGVRERAAWALGAIEDSRAVMPLTSVLRDAYPLVREQAAWALGAIEAPEAVPALSRALGDEDPGVREKSAWALGAIESRRAVDALVATLNDPVSEVRKMAAWALGAIGDDAATDGLIARMEDQDLEVRRMVVWALSQMNE